MKELVTEGIRHFFVFIRCVCVEICRLTDILSKLAELKQKLAELRLEFLELLSKFDELGESWTQDNYCKHNATWLFGTQAA